jgi:hypothetical protein
MLRMFPPAIGLWHGIEGGGRAGPCHYRSHHGGDQGVEEEEIELGRQAPSLKKKKVLRQGVVAVFNGGGGATDGSETNTMKENGS